MGLEVQAAGLPAHPFPMPSARTAFEAPLGPEWNHLRHPTRASYSLDARPAWLTLHGEAASLGATASPTWVGRRQQHMSCRVATLVDFVPALDGEEAGISLYMNPDHRYEIGVRRAGGRRQVFVRQRIGPHLETITASAPLEGNEPVLLQVEAIPEEYAFWFGIAISGRPQSATAPLGKGRALPLVRGGRRLHGRLHRPVRHRQRPVRVGTGPLRLVRLRAAVRPGGPIFVGRHDRASCHTPPARITVTVDSLSRSRHAVVRYPPGPGIARPLGHPFLMSGTSARPRPVERS